MTQNQPTIHHEVTAEDGATIVALAGSLADEANVEAKELLLPLLDEKPSRLILDLSGLDYISSSGIGLLVSILRRSRQAGVHLVLCGLTPDIQDLFRLTRLHQVFEIRDDRDEALGRR